MTDWVTGNRVRCAFGVNAFVDQSLQFWVQTKSTKTFFEMHPRQTLVELRAEKGDGVG